MKHTLRTWFLLFVVVALLIQSYQVEILSKKLSHREKVCNQYKAELDHYNKWWDEYYYKSEYIPKIKK
jgi:hypothetical protein